MDDLEKAQQELAKSLIRFVKAVAQEAKPHVLRLASELEKFAESVETSLEQKELTDEERQHS